MFCIGVILFAFFARFECVKMTISAVQTSGSPLNDLNNPTATDVDNNLDFLREKAEECSNAGSRIMVLPELFLTGYNIGKSLIDSRAEFNNGPSFKEVSSIASEYNITIVYGFPEIDEEDIVYNSANVVSNEGKLLLTYRKVHLFGDGERELFTPGDEIGPILEIEGVKIGIAICYDVEFPETIRELTLQGAQVVLIPTANMDPYIFVNDYIIPVRAAENNVYIFYTNRVGWENATSPILLMLGESKISDPNGEILKTLSSTEDEVSHVEIDSSLCSGESDWSYLDDRRDGLYGHICDCDECDDTDDDVSKGSLLFFNFFLLFLCIFWF